MFVIYSQKNNDPESDMIYICECKTREGAFYVVRALKAFNGEMYDYYVKEV